MIACANGNIDVVKMLLNRGADIHIEDKSKWTALTWSIEKKYPKIANILLERGADPNHKDDQKTPLIHFAVFNNDYESVKLLIEYNVKLKARDQYGLTPYVYALKEKNKKIVEIIKDNGGTY